MLDRDVKSRRPVFCRMHFQGSIGCCCRSLPRGARQKTMHHSKFLQRLVHMMYVTGIPKRSCVCISHVFVSCIFLARHGTTELQFKFMFQVCFKSEVFGCKAWDFLSSCLQNGHSPRQPELAATKRRQGVQIPYPVLTHCRYGCWCQKPQILGT